MNTGVKGRITTKIHCRHSDDTYTLQMSWPGQRMTSLETARYLDTKFFISDMTLEDMRIMATDIMAEVLKEEKSK